MTANPYWTSEPERFRSIDPRLRLRERLQWLFHAVVGARPACIVVCAIDNFSVVNDYQGRAVGDAVLTSAFSALVSSLPAGGVAGRLAGDVFVAAFPGDGIVALRTAAALAPELRKVHASLAWSTGTALQTAAEVSAWGAGMQNAERALDEAKRRGGNIVLRFRGVDAYDVVASGPTSRLAYGDGSRTPDPT